MGVVRVNAIGPGAVVYLTQGCDPVREEPAVDLEGPNGPGEGPERGHAHSHDAVMGRDLDHQLEGTGPSGRGQWVSREGANYFRDGVEQGEPAGRWLGSGMKALGLPYRAGHQADTDVLGAVFGELRYPTEVNSKSTADSPVHLGRKPRSYKTLSERVDKALKAEPEASAERQREIELGEAQKKNPSATAYYDVTFSAVKSASVLYAALLAAGDTDTAQAIVDAHEQAVRMAVEAMETEIAWARTGTHGRAGKSGQTVGEWQQAAGISAVLFSHHTNRDAEPQLHAHVAILNRVALADGRIFALDGKAFAPILDAMNMAYDRAFEALVSAAAGVTFIDRVDGKGREVAGIDQAAMDDASTRTREGVQPKLDALTQEFKDNNGGREPSPRERNRIRNKAVKQSRSPKTGPAGPAAVVAWIDREPGRREGLEETLVEARNAGFAAAVAGQVPMTREELLATGQEPVATPGMELATAAAEAAIDAGVAVPMNDAAATARAEAAAVAVPAALADVQSRYAAWNLGNLVQAIDRQLGPDAGRLQLSIEGHRAWVWGLAEQAVAGLGGEDVVQVRLGDPVPVPAELRREVDGHSRFRPHRNELYATAAHVSDEQRLTATALETGTAHVAAEVAAAIAERAQQHKGLSSDQATALAGVLSSDRRIEVLVGPAGSGKSRTVGELSDAWTELHGGKVIGAAIAEIATRNLAGLGMEAINTYRLLELLTPDERGLVKMRLTDRDLIVVDEAGMVDTKTFVALARAAHAAGAKMIATGDHHQLSSVGAGGMFAHLTTLPGTIELDQVHRFHSEWEKDASLRLRAGDTTVAAVYANEGRLRSGTLEQIEFQAGRDYVADRLDPAVATSLLIVESNEQAARLSENIQRDLVMLGVVQPEPLLKAQDKAMLREGDLIQTHLNNRTLRVDGAYDESKQWREGLAVTNRELYTVIGYDAAADELLARDERGGVAHLPAEYVAESVTLAYAVTNHSAQSLTVQRGRHLAGRSATAASMYPGSTRGFEYNIIYLETEVAADEHNQQRVRDTDAARMAQVMERGTPEQAAIAVMADSIAEMSSMLTLGDYYDRVATERGHGRHSALITEHLGEAVLADPSLPALLGKLQAVEFAGHDVAAVFTQAVAQRELDTARSVAETMAWRVGKVVEDRTPDRTPDEVVAHRATAVRPAWDELAAQHHARAEVTGSEVETMIGRLADKAHARTQELGAAQAAAPSPWALEWLGPVPDAATNPDAHRQWSIDAGQVAAYREYQGVPEDQISIGEAPAETKQLAHELWTRAVAVGDGDPRAVDWRKFSDVELRETVVRWERELQRQPQEVSEERSELIALAHDARNEKIFGQARLDAMAADDPMREMLQARVNADEVMENNAEGFAARLHEAHALREAWWVDTTPQREAAASASKELERRTPTAELPEQQEQSPAGATHDVGPDQAVPAPAAPAQPMPDQPEMGAASGGRAPRGEQQSLDLDLEVGTPRGGARFDEGFAAARERGLAEVDPDGTMTLREREAAFGRQVGAEVHEQLRREHGARLDPDNQLDGPALAQAWMREVTAEAQQRGGPVLAGAAQVGQDELDPADQTADQTRSGSLADPTHRQEQSPEPGLAEPAAPEHGTSAEHGERQAAPEVEGQAPTRADVAAGHETVDRSGLEEATAARAGEAMRELRRVERETFLARAARDAAPAPVQESGVEAQTPRQRMEAMEQEGMLDDEVAARRGPSLEQRTKEREQQLEQQRQLDDGMEM